MRAPFRDQALALEARRTALAAEVVALRTVIDGLEATRAAATRQDKAADRAGFALAWRDLIGVVAFCAVVGLLGLLASWLVCSAATRPTVDWSFTATTTSSTHPAIPIGTRCEVRAHGEPDHCNLRVTCTVVFPIVFDTIGRCLDRDEFVDHAPSSVDQTPGVVIYDYGEHALLWDEDAGGARTFELSLQAPRG